MTETPATLLDSPPPKKPVLTSVSTIYLSFILLIAPIKLGSVVGTGGIALFPDGIFSWLLGGWPPAFTPVFTGLALILVLLERRGRPLPPLRLLLFLTLPALLLTISCLIGFIRTTETDMALIFFWHILSLTSLCFAIILHLEQTPEARWTLIGALTAGGLCSAYSGIYQRFWGLNETREMLYQMYREQGTPIPAGLLSRLNQNRVFAGFTYPNNFAAHLILTAPPALVLLFRWGNKIEPARVSRLLFSAIGLLLFGAALIFTGSRAAVVAIVLAGILTLCVEGVREMNRRGRYPRKMILLAIALFILMLTSGGILLKVMNHGRKWSSLGARITYYQCAWQMFRQHPVTGVGMGEFFPWYMRLKPPKAEETRIPHNLFLGFLAQCGLVGGLAALFFLAQPLLILLFANRFTIQFASRSIRVATFLGATAWLVHSLADFNIQISGTVITAGILPFLALKIPRVSTKPGASQPLLPMLWILALLTLGNVWRLPGERSFSQLTALLNQPGIRLGRIQEKAEQSSRFLPYSPYPWDILGKIAFSARNFELAAFAFSKAVERAPHRASFHAHLAKSYLLTGDLKKAEKRIKEALKWYPYDPKYQEIAQKIKARIKRQNE